MNNSVKWYEKEGPVREEVVSTRVRLARNLRQYPFSCRATAQQKAEIEEKVKSALLSGNSILSREFRFVPLEDLNEIQSMSLVERHVVSPEFIADPRGKAVLVNEDESVSIMINEEDHLRIQVMGSGLTLKETAETADRLDTLLGETLDFAFDPQLGYLTQCPTNLGIGMRASVMLHLPALTATGAMNRLFASLSKLGMALRGSYGEGSKVVGDMYQLSNQISLGLSEAEALANLSSISDQIIEQERKARQQLLSGLSAQDKVFRAAGVLKSARLLSSEECMELLSLVRLGLTGGLLHGLDFAALNSLCVKLQPNTLSANSNVPLDEAARDTLRATVVRSALETIKE